MIDEWVRLPSRWINDKGLGYFSWKAGGEGSAHTAALMALTAIAHGAIPETGLTRGTYDELCAATGLSRAKLSNGLDVLREFEIVGRGPESGRSTYQLLGYNFNRGWAKLPKKSMYSHGRITAFADFQLRKPIELEALKLFFLFVARRGNDTNVANIGYEKIEEYTDIQRPRIKPAISYLASLSLIYVEHFTSRTSPERISSGYRIVGIDPHNHAGTTGRGQTDYTEELQS